MKEATKSVLKAVGQILGGAVVVVGSWLATRAETGELKDDAASAAVEAAEARVAEAEAAALAAEQRQAEAERKVELAHDANADAINNCLDGLAELEEEHHELIRDFDRLAGAVEAFHGQRRVAAAAERVPDAPPPHPPKPRAKAPAFQMLE